MPTGAKIVQEALDAGSRPGKLQEKALCDGCQVSPGVSLALCLLLQKLPFSLVLAQDSLHQGNGGMEGHPFRAVAHGLRLVISILITNPFYRLNKGL